jgi:uncharacterized metal-binding protein
MDAENNRNKLDEVSLVYSCSGCSNIAQLANDVAVKMDREGFAEMSCIAGVGGNVIPLVQKAKSRRKIIAIDGCVLKCAKSCLNNVGVEPKIHYVLTDYGLKKEYHKDYKDETVNEIFELIIQDNCELVLSSALT